MSEHIEIEVAYATAKEQVIVKIAGDSGMTVKDAIVQSHIAEKFPEIDPETAKVGIYGKTVGLDDELSTGDRVEIYRELIADPKAARKKKAATGDKKEKTEAEVKDKA